MAGGSSRDRGSSRRDLLRSALAASVLGACGAASGTGCGASGRRGPSETTTAAARARVRLDVGQLLWAGFGGPPHTEVAVPRWLARAVKQGDVGAALFFHRDAFDPAQLEAVNRELHDAAPAEAPFLTGLDQEGGRVQTLRAPATVWPPMARLGALAARTPGGAAGVAPLAGEIGRAIGDELAALGFDMNFAPVLDVLSNAKNRVIGDRAFATTADAVTQLAGALAASLDTAGLLACGKHFPGHGRTDDDSHFTLPVVTASRAELQAVDLAPFRALIDLPLVMTAHVAYDALDPGVPGTLSPRVVRGLLRDTLGFRGVVVSDDLEMGAITRHHDVGEAAVRALLAGCDALIMGHWPNSLTRARAALLRAAEQSTEARGRIAESAARIRALKQRHVARATTRPALTVIGAKAHRRLADAMVEGALD